MSADEKGLAHKRLPKFEVIDEVRMRIVPRYKTSGMSGDEWRHHVEIELLFKGELIASHTTHDMQAAVLDLGHAWLHVDGCGIPDKVIEVERTKCDQPSCKNDAIARLVIKRHTATDGQWLDASAYGGHRWYRQFCSVHVRRGDCSREDSDDNYEPIDGIGPEGSTNTQESPASFGGFVVLE